MNIRDKRQKEFADIAYKKKNGLLHLTARFGKIKTCFLFIKPTDKVLVIYPKLPIKKSWSDDSIKWKFNISNFEFITTASLKKVAVNKYDWVIWDEPQEVLSEKVLSYINILSKENNIIGLSGSLSAKTLDKIKLWTRLEVIAEYPQELAIQEGVVTDYQITVQGLDLDKSLYGKYTWVSNAIDECKANMQYHKLKSLALMRMRILHSSVDRLTLAKKFIDSNKDNRVIIFTHLTKFADSLGVPVYHSKKKDDDILELFKEAHIKHLATLDMVGAGITFKNLNKALICTFTSNAEELYQRISRITAMEMDNPDKKAHVHILYIRNTQEEVWLKSALSMFENTKIKYI
jgi:superfamily II DNA or RNA helicase